MVGCLLWVYNRSAVEFSKNSKFGGFSTNFRFTAVAVKFPCLAMRKFLAYLTSSNSTNSSPNGTKFCTSLGHNIIVLLWKGLWIKFRISLCEVRWMKCGIFTAFMVDKVKPKFLKSGTWSKFETTWRVERKDCCIQIWKKICRQIKIKRAGNGESLVFFSSIDWQWHSPVTHAYDLKR